MEIKEKIIVVVTTVTMLAVFIGFQPTVQQAAQTETVEDALKDASFVCNKLEEVTVTLRGANDLWAEAFKKSILRMPYIQPELYSMTYVLEVDFPDWDNELRATHLPEVKVASDGDVTLLRTQEFGRSSRQNSGDMHSQLKRSVADGSGACFDQQWLPSGVHDRKGCVLAIDYSLFVLAATINSCL